MPRAARFPGMSIAFPGRDPPWLPVALSQIEAGGPLTTPVHGVGPPSEQLEHLLTRKVHIILPSRGNIRVICIVDRFTRPTMFRPGDEISLLVH